VREVYSALHAVIIYYMQDRLTRSGKYLSDLMVAHDRNKDNCLEYDEFESMLLDIGVSFKPKVYNILIKELMDVNNKANGRANTADKGKISFDIIKHIIGDNTSGRGGTDLDYLPSQEVAKDGSAGKGTLSPGQLKSCRSAARKSLIAFGGGLSETLQKADPQSVGMLKVEQVKAIIEERAIADLQPSELQFLLSHCDSNNFGFFVIPNFCTKLQELASETEAEVKLRRFAKAIGH